MHTRKTPQIPRPYHQLKYQKKRTLTNEFLCVTSSGQMSAQTLVCQTARSGPLGRDISWQALACWTARSLRCLTSCRGHSASTHSAQKLGEAIACGTALSWTARPCGCDRRQTQTGSDARPLDQVVVQLLCCSVSPFVVLKTLPSEPCLLGRTLSVTPEWPVCSSPGGTSPGLSGSPRTTCFAPDVLSARPHAVPAA